MSDDRSSNFIFSETLAQPRHSPLDALALAQLFPLRQRESAQGAIDGGGDDESGFQPCLDDEEVGTLRLII